jgi:hypothetical protein
MQYMLLIYSNEAGMQAASKTDAEQMMAAYGAYGEAMKKAGVIRGGDRLRPSASATASPRCSTGPMPRPRSSSAATSSSTCPTSTPR